MNQHPDDHGINQKIPSSSISWVRNVVDALTECGLDGMSLSNKAGIPSSIYGHSEACVPAINIARLWDLALTESGNSDIGLQAAASFRPSSLDAVGYLMMSSDTLLEAIQRGVRYHSAHSSATNTSFVSTDDGYALVFHIMTGIVGTQRQNHDFIMLCILKFFRFMTGRDLNPLRAEFIYPDPECKELHQKMMQCPVMFNAKRTALHFSHVDLERSLITSNPLLVEMHEHAAIKRIQHFGKYQTTQWVRQLIAKSLPDGEPSRDAIAACMEVSSRKIQRQLAEEGTNFSLILDDVRRNLSKHYLSNAQLPLTDIVYLLGFSEQSTFTRAVKRWYGLSPNKARALFRHSLETGVRNSLPN
jgi:AraC-like DNA-binding protein